MKTIKFSHWHKKLNVLGDIVSAKLLEVIEVKIENLSLDFLAYDTDEVFKLPKKGEYLLLIFEGANGIFTTLRPKWPPTKIHYYRKSIGSIFKFEFS